MDDPHSSFGRFLYTLFRGGEDVTEQEIISMVDEGNMQGVLQDNEAEMIRNIFQLNDTSAKDIMTHRKNIIGVDCTWTLREVYHFVIKQNYSRFPIYDADIDRIMGTMHIRDLMLVYEDRQNRDRIVKDLPELIRPAMFIPETRSINRLFEDMQRQKYHIAIVIDEYGLTAGLVSMEDILEEIVGNIQDEYDEEEEFIVKNDDGTYLVRGLTELEELEDRLGIFLEDDNNETLNGYLITRLERIPSQEEETEIEDEHCIYRILSVENNIISRVHITVKNSKNEED